jgi:hypothetical protein
MWLKIVVVVVVVIEFNWHLLTCRLNSTIVHYKTNTNTRTIQIHYKHNNNNNNNNEWRFRIGIPSFKKRVACVLAFDQSLFSLFSQNAHQTQHRHRRLIK